MYDIVIWGATGFSGRQAAIYMNKMYASNGSIKMAIAGRSKSKLEKVHSELANPNVDILICAGADAEAAERVAKSTKLVCSSVGPAAKYSNEMVDACIKNGTDYCDLSGEIHWLRKMYDTKAQEAVDAGVLVVNVCGLDSIPTEYGVKTLQEAAFAKYGEYCNEIKGCFADGHIDVAGGSFESGKGVMEAIANDPVMADMVSNPYSLNPKGQIEGNPPCPDLESVVYDKDFSQYVMPFPVGQINARVVRRAHALDNYPYGKDFIYSESKLAGNGLINKIKAQLETFFVDLFVSANPTKGIGKMLMSLGPKEGSGPSDEKMTKNGPYSFVFFGRTPSGKTLRAYSYSPLDAHRGTAALMCETAICVLKHRQELKQQSGFWTPGTAIGEMLKERIAAHDVLEFGIGELSDCADYVASM